MSEYGRTRAHVYVSGHVQGIYYRAMTHDATHDRGVDGWARSLSDGHVEAVLEGPRDDVEAMIEWCHEGSPMTTVKDVGVTSGEPDGETGLCIER